MASKSEIEAEMRRRGLKPRALEKLDAPAPKYRMQDVDDAALMHRERRAAPREEAPAAPVQDITGRDLARSASSGLGFGTGAGEAITGGLAATMAKLSGEEAPIGEIYDDIRGAESMEADRFAMEHPDADMAANAAGSLLIPTGLLARGASAVAKGGKNFLPSSYRSGRAASGGLPRATGATGTPALPSAARAVSRPVEQAVESVAPRVGPKPMSRPIRTKGPELPNGTRIDVASRLPKARAAKAAPAAAAKATAEVPEAVAAVAKPSKLAGAKKIAGDAVVGASLGDLIADNPTAGALLSMPYSKRVMGKMVGKMVGSAKVGTLFTQMMYKGNRKGMQAILDKIKK